MRSKRSSVVIRRFLYVAYLISLWVTSLALCVLATLRDQPPAVLGHPRLLNLAKSQRRKVAKPARYSNTTRTVVPPGVTELSFLGSPFIPTSVSTGFWAAC